MFLGLPYLVESGRLTVSVAQGVTENRYELGR